LTGRLAEIFTPRLYVIFASTTLAIGLFITAAAPTLTVFLLGRAVAGIGSGGLMSIAIILVVDLASPKRRGLCIGMINAGYTTGLASGAVLAGLMTSSLGWVCRPLLALEGHQIN
jgi:predicted MFS family arabinose efflux permease